MAPTEQPARLACEGMARVAGRVGFVVAVFAALSALVVVTTAATEGSDPNGESAVELAVFAQSGPPTHDGQAEVVLDQAKRRADGTVDLVGWAIETDRVEILADGQVVATVPIEFERIDVAVAHGLRNGFVGFSARVAIPDDTFLICAVRPGQLPGPDACDRTTLHLPRQRVVAFYGVPGVPVLGTLGSGSATQARRRLVQQAAPYETTERPVMLAFEILGTVAQGSAGPDGNFSEPIDQDLIWEYLHEIRKVGGVVVIDLQPGNDDYIDQLPQFDGLLREPDVHVALDPEWHMRPGQVPGQVVGQSSAGDVNAIMDYLDDIVVEHRLPRKVVVAHNFQPRMITNRDRLDPPASIDLVVHMDGHGPPANKIGNYERLVALQDAFTGFKLFYKRDVPLLGPKAVLDLRPEIDFVSYQ